MKIRVCYQDLCIQLLISLAFLGAEDLLATRGVQVVVLERKDCAALMSQYIDANNAQWNEDIGEQV